MPIFSKPEPPNTFMVKVPEMIRKTGKSLFPQLPLLETSSRAAVLPALERRKVKVTRSFPYDQS